MLAYKLKALIIITVCLTVSVQAQDSINETFQSGNFSSGAEPGNRTIGAGAVVNMNVSSPRAESDNWAGVFGNVTSQYIIGSDTGSPFFSWELLSANYVYASPQDLDFTSSWQPGNISYLKIRYPFLENTIEEPAETFTATNSTVNSKFQSDPVEDTLVSYTNNASGTSIWETHFLSDGDRGFFAGRVRDGRSFNNKESDYQLILPENGDEQGGTAYSMYLELE